MVVDKCIDKSPQKRYTDLHCCMDLDYKDLLIHSFDLKIPSYIDKCNRLIHIYCIDHYLGMGMIYKGRWIRI